MKNLLLTTILTLSFISISSANDRFQLSQTDVSNTGISRIINAQLNSGLDSCLDYCDEQFIECYYSGEWDYICELDLNDCEDDCYYDYQ